MTKHSTNREVTTAPLRLLNMQELEHRIGRSRWWIRERVMQDPHFPKPVEMAGRRVSFIEGEVEAWITGLVAKRDGVA